MDKRINLDYWSTKNKNGLIRSVKVVQDQWEIKIKFHDTFCVGSFNEIKLKTIKCIIYI